MLIMMAERMAQDGMAKRFREALVRENDHLAKVRGWCESLSLTGAEPGERTAKSH
jgi:hypothetical protein